MLHIFRPPNQLNASIWSWGPSHLLSKHELRPLHTLPYNGYVMYTQDCKKSNMWSPFVWADLLREAEIGEGRRQRISWGWQCQREARREEEEVQWSTRLLHGVKPAQPPRLNCTCLALSPQIVVVDCDDPAFSLCIVYSGFHRLTVWYI